MGISRSNATASLKVPVDKGQVNTVTSGQTTTSTSYVDVAGSSFTLPKAGTYLVQYTAAVNNNTGAASVYTALTDQSNNIVAGTISSMDEANSLGVTGVNAGSALITVTSSALYKMRFRVDGGTGSILNNTTDAQTTITWVEVPTNTVVAPGGIAVNDNASSGYFDIGTMRLQWGLLPVGVSGTLTFPAPFADTNYSFAATANASATGNNFGIMMTAKGTNSLNYHKKFAANGDAGETFNWLAVGRKP